MATAHRYRIPKGETAEMPARAIAVNILGLPSKHDAKVIIDAIDRGFETASVSRLAEYLSVPEGEVLTVVDISRSTFSRRKKAKRLTMAESDRLYRLTRLLSRAVAVLEDEAEARQWCGPPSAPWGMPAR